MHQSRGRNWSPSRLPTDARAATGYIVVRFLSLTRASPSLARWRKREDGEKEETPGETGEGARGGGEGKHETNRSAHARHPAFTFLGRREYVSRATRCLNLATRHNRRAHVYVYICVYMYVCTVYVHRRRRVAEMLPRRRLNPLQERKLADS